MISVEEKQALIQSLLKRVQHEYQTLAAAHKATQEGATHEEAKPENDKDTRALEQSYLARGQAERVLQLKGELALLSQLRLRSFEPTAAIGLSALLKLQDDSGTEKLYFLCPTGAGEELESSLGPVKVITPLSPLGRALLGAHLDDDVELQSPKGKRTVSVVALG